MLLRYGIIIIIIIIIIVIVIVIVIIDLYTLHNVSLPGNFHMSQIVGGIRLSQEKDIHPIP